MEYSKGYLLIHLITCHPHIPRYRWIRTTQYRSFAKNYGSIEINVARLTKKSWKEELVAMNLQEKTVRRSKTKVKHNGGLKSPLTSK